jgi:beta-N-acetylhexosaminidase
VLVQRGSSSEEKRYNTFMRIYLTTAIWSFLIAALFITTWQFVPAHHLVALLPHADGSDATQLSNDTPSILHDFKTITERARMLEQFTLREKIGQMFMIGHWHQNEFYHTANMLRAYDFGGVIIMDVSAKNSDFVSVWTKHWMEDSVVLPPLVSIDQEGGLVSRLRGPGYEVTSQRMLTTPEEAYQTGQRRGAQLAELGINVNLAPVLDTSVNPDAFLYDRSFVDPTVSADLAHQLITSHRATGVLSAVKHYPGHADTADDSHLLLPVIPIAADDYAEFTHVFTDTITTSAPAIVMTAHVLLPNIDPTYPATLSYEILTNRLRNEVGFEGIIMTDDMTMRAITNSWTTDEATVQAIKAGADMILFAAEPNKSIAALEAVVAAVERGEISEDRINQSVERIYQVKQSLFPHIE